MHLKIQLKKIIYLFFSKFINYNLFYFKTFSKHKYIYFNDFSFAGIFIFYLENYFEIKKKKLKVLIFSQLEKEISKLFFTTEQIKNIFLLIPTFIPLYGVNKLLVNEKYFTPKKSLFINWEKRKVLNKHKNLLIKLLKSKLNLISPELKKIQREKFILLFIKHYKNKKINFYDGSIARHTEKLNKIFKLINFFVKKKKIVVILGNNYDNSLPILKNKYKNYKQHSVLFFKDLSLKQSIYDQLFVHYFSSLSIGSDSGAFVMSQYLKKKILYFDAFQIKNQFYQKFKNTKTLYKKIIYDGKIENLSLDNLNKIPKMHNKYLITENSFSEIVNGLKKIKYKF